MNFEGGVLSEMPLIVAPLYGLAASVHHASLLDADEVSRKTNETKTTRNRMILGFFIGTLLSNLVNSSELCQLKPLSSIKGPHPLNDRITPFPSF
jgi:hypothetical protein